MSIAYGAVYGYHDSIYTVGHKNTPNFFGQNFKKGYSILIFLVHIFMTQLAIKWPFSFPPHTTSSSALPGETNQANYYICIECDIII